MNQTLETGTVLHGSSSIYTIKRILGQGSFGITYLATTQLEGPLGKVEVEVAVKEFFMKDINTREGSSVIGSNSRDGLFEKYRLKFRREAQNLSRMVHPGIVKVIELFDTNNTSYIVMQYLGGGSLDDLIAQRGRLSEDEAVRMTHSIGNALSYMHAHNMLHLDLKPSNVMLDRQGEPVIIDFGLSKQYDGSGNPESSTTVGGGTPGYAPIEQTNYHEGKEFPVTMDVYALGATLFKMLTGHRPPDSSDLFNNGFPMFDMKGVSPATTSAVVKAMALRKADRYQTVDAFLADLKGNTIADEATYIVSIDSPTLEREEKTHLESVKVTPPPKSPQPVTQPHPSWQESKPNTPSKNRKTLIWAVLAIAVVVVGMMVYNLWKNKPSYVDLGLPSGTLWKNQNETGKFYTFDDAVEKFGDRLPTETQCQELINKCSWTWNGKGYTVVGPNGNSISLPASGHRFCDERSVSGGGGYGYYWSSTSKDSDYALYLRFNSGSIYMDHYYQCCGLSVRLVK